MVFGENQTHDFLRFIRCPEIVQKQASICSITLACEKKASPNSNKSLAKKICDNFEPPCLILIATYDPSLTASPIYWLISSIHKTKRYGDNGSPWCRPLVGLNGLSAFPFQVRDSPTQI